MSKTTFKTNPVALETLLRQCGDGKIQLPDFQRSWVWAEDRILSLIASISSAFPIGALMTLESKHGATIFARRPVQGAPPAAEVMTPDELLLDGQQRMTSLYQACLRQAVVETITPKNKLVKRWFYIDIQNPVGIFLGAHGRHSRLAHLCVLCALGGKINSHGQKSFPPQIRRGPQA